MPVKVRERIAPALASPGFVLDAQPPAQPHSGVVVDRPVRFRDGAYFEVVRHPRNVRFNWFTSSVVCCQVHVRVVSAWTFSTMRLMLFFDGRYPRYAFPVLAEYIRPNV